MKSRLILCVTTVTVMLLSAPLLGDLPSVGLIAHWKADGDFTEEIAGRDGSAVNGVGFIPGKFGQAFDLGFGGTTGYVSVPDDDVWTHGGDFTVSLWARWSQLATGTIGNPEDIFISHDNSGGTHPKWLFAKGGGKLNFHLNGPVPSEFLAQTDFTPELATWYNLVVRREGDLFTIFVDGVEGSSELSSSAIPNASVPLMIGRGEAFRFDGGAIDDVAIYNLALSNADIEAIAAGGSVVPVPGAAVLGVIGISMVGAYTRKRRLAHAA